MKVSLLYAEYLRIHAAHGLNQEAVGSVSDHGNKGADIHAIMWRSEKDNAVYRTKESFVIGDFRSRHCYQ